MHAFISPSDPDRSLRPSTSDNRVQSSGDRTARIAQGANRTLPGGDPVIRLLLIKKGIVSVEEIDEIEAQLRASGVAGHDPSKGLG